MCFFFNLSIHSIIFSTIKRSQRMSSGAIHRRRFWSVAGASASPGSAQKFRHEEGGNHPPTQEEDESHKVDGLVDRPIVREEAKRC